MTEREIAEIRERWLEKEWEKPAMFRSTQIIKDIRALLHEVERLQWGIREIRGDLILISQTTAGAMKRSSELWTGENNDRERDS